MRRIAGQQSGALRRLPRLSAALGLSLVLAVTGCGSNSSGSTADESSEENASGEQFGPEGIRLIVASSPGGGYDRATRLIEPYMSEALGTELSVEYQDAADGAVAMELLRNAQDCSTVVQSGKLKVLLGQAIQDVEYSYLDDFASVGGFTRDYAVLMANTNSEFDSIQSVIDHARENPGNVDVAVGTFASDGKSVVALQNAADVEFNIVPFGGGTEAENALFGEKVTVAQSSLFNTLPLAEDVKVLVVIADENPIPDRTDDAPTANEALGIDVIPQEKVYSLFVSKACQEQFPQQFEALSTALKEAVENEEFKADVEELGQAGWFTFIPPDEFRQIVETEISEITAFVEEEDISAD